MLVLRLTHAGIVEIQVLQIAPTCRAWGVVRVRGHAGVNRIRFRGRVKGKMLPAGTYRLRVRANGSSRVAVVRLVIVRDRAPSAAELAARSCTQTGSDERLSDEHGLSGFRGGTGQGLDSGVAAARTGNSEVKAGGVLNAQALREGPEGDVQSGLSLLLLAGLLCAAALFGVVALPGRAIPNARVASLVVDRRLDFALAAGALVAVTAIAYALLAT